MCYVLILLYFICVFTNLQLTILAVNYSRNSVICHLQFWQNDQVLPPAVLAKWSGPFMLYHTVTPSSLPPPSPPPPHTHTALLAKWPGPSMLYHTVTPSSLPPPPPPPPTHTHTLHFCQFWQNDLGLLCYTILSPSHTIVLCFVLIKW